MKLNELQKQVVGLDAEVILLDGSKRRYVNFDNAASTPPLLPVQQKVNEFCRWYSNVHRGTGFKSQISSWVFEEGRRMIADFVKADEKSSVIFCKNTTEAINKLASRFCCPAAGEEKPVILTTIMEHHSNELPWRRVGKVVHIALNPDGTINTADFDEKLKKYGGQVQLLAVNGASNVTGYINPIHEFARKVHEVGAQIAVDAAQLAPHRPIDVKPSDSPEHLDYLAFAAHKMYAPFGIGVLVTAKNLFEIRDPEYVGGGTVDVVSLESAYWKDLPEREEAGTPDIVGVIALAEVIKLIEEVGFQEIIAHEAELTAYALKKLNAMPEIIIYGDKNPENAAQRLGVISFNVKGVHHALVAAILSYEGGIGVRNGCFCSQPYVNHLLNISSEEQEENKARILARDRSKVPGTVRISFGMYNTKEEIDYFCDVLNMIIKQQYKGKYVMNKERGEYYPEGFKLDFSTYFQF
ncbi:MAG TPA: aminotransferase class V-fold PLP-dependent enzyme [candidate division WOR-3 bacterium]|uniref:Aminotransferase class V-fold PLP-dependent enzyme n=1 Tax=candidate division WOR-3 bacterium TaxID=2052148 RepID=A0A9C9ELE7_UNCW3|nr:aminotransferase class V-fold PLP-dependent enzyme [candidate division WOR-3 bacterium]